MSKHIPKLTQDFDYEAVAETIVRLAPVYRTPFISIIGFSEAFLEGIEGELSDSQKADIEAIRSSGWQALGQLSDIIDVMALMSGEITYEQEAITPADLLEDVKRDFGKTYGENEKTLLQINMADNLPSITGDQPRLRQMLLGLIRSALQDAPEQPVYLNAKTDDDGLLLELQDSCEVANEDDLDYFFDAGWLSRMTNNRWRRMQWETYLAHHFVEAHNGKTWVEKVAEVNGKPGGTRISFWFPAKSDAS